MNLGAKIAVYTTVHPGTLPYLREWHAAMLSQSHGDFDLWIGVDQVSDDVLRRAVGRPLDACIVRAQCGDTPARLRERAIEALIDRYDCVVFVDSDDVPAVERVERAVAALDDADVMCCTLELIDADGHSLGGRFAPPEHGYGIQPIQDAWLLNGNIVGLGNSAFRCDCLRRTLSIPRTCVAVDWLLATRAWLQGMRIAFDSESGGLYRRHADCVTPIRPPFTMAAVRTATQIVLDHHDGVPQRNVSYMRDRKAVWDERRFTVAEFAERIYSSQPVANAYVCALNALPVVHTWWSCVAHPALERTWRRS